MRADWRLFRRLTGRRYRFWCPLCLRNAFYASYVDRCLLHQVRIFSSLRINAVGFGVCLAFRSGRFFPPVSLIGTPMWPECEFYFASYVQQLIFSICCRGCKNCIPTFPDYVKPKYFIGFIIFALIMAYV
jgi:hypothetical protein